MKHFHNLKVVDVREETSDTVSIAFEVPEDKEEKFNYIPGQYVTLRLDIDGNDVRRSYSMCSSPFSSEPIRIAVKRVENGLVSNYLNDSVKVGDEIGVMPPHGSFLLETDQGKNTYVAFAAGSGITPIWSMIKSVLKKESQSKFVLFYGNQTTETIIFKNEIEALAGDRLAVHHILSKEDTSDPMTSGRINKSKAAALLGMDLSVSQVKAFYMCGPEGMIMEVKDALHELGVSDDRINFELFTTPVIEKEGSVGEHTEFMGIAKIKVIYDEEETEFELASVGENILEAAMRHDVDAPFSCKGAVCCTCKAKVTEGKMIMDANYALSDEEVAEGFVLACQAHPASENVVLDFDEA